MMITVAALGIEPAALRDRFQERGLATTVFTDEERDLAPKRYVDPIREGADIERVFRPIDLVWLTRDSV